MKLADYMYERDITPTRIRTLLGVNKSTIWRYLYGKRRPSPTKIKEIEALTEGRVTEVDWDDPFSPPKCARWVVGPDGEPMWVLPWSAGWDTASPTRPHRELTITWRPDLSAGNDQLSAPVRYALSVLGNRAALLKSGVFTLDGRVCALKQVILAANEVLAAKGEEPIAYPGVRAVE